MYDADLTLDFIWSQRSKGLSSKLFDIRRWLLFLHQKKCNYGPNNKDRYHYSCYATTPYSWFATTSTWWAVIATRLVFWIGFSGWRCTGWRWGCRSWAPWVAILPVMKIVQIPIVRPTLFSTKNQRIVRKTEDMVRCLPQVNVYQLFRNPSSETVIFNITMTHKHKYFRMMK